MVEEHIHIISSGENIHNTFPTAINEYKMTKAVIIVEKSVYDKPDHKRNPKIIESINHVKEIAVATKKSFEIKLINSISLYDVRDAVMDITQDNDSGAKYYFNITGGTKVLSNGLFMMGIWLDAIIYHVGEDEVLQRLIIPKIHTDEIRKNVNYISILEILSNSKTRELHRKDLFTQLKKVYRPIRSLDKKTKRNLSPGTLSKWSADLQSWGLIDERNPEGNKKEKILKITDDGMFILKFITATGKR